MEVGTKYGRYEICAKLGTGGMGVVYLARDEQLQRPVALKMMSAGNFGADEAARFRQEARAASALNHPNIITVYEIGETAEGLFLATEFIDGETLREKINCRELSPGDALKIAGQIAEALSVAHAYGIIHRDVKPENLMIRRDGYVKILDFGLAKSILAKQIGNEDATIQAVQTSPGLVIGSVRYMSPEQARGQKVDARTDIWSLGAVLYEMLTGKPPFEGESITDSLAALIHLEPQPVTDFLPDAPAALVRIVEKALRKKVDERYQNAADFALDLKNLRDELERGHVSNFHTKDFSTVSENPTTVFSTLTGETSPNQTDNSQKLGASGSFFTEIGRTTDSLIAANNPAKRFWTLLCVLVLMGGAGFAVYRLLGKTEKRAAVFEKTQIALLPSDGKLRLPTISPDGNFVAYVSGEIGSRRIIVRQIAFNNAIEILPPTAQRITSLDFAPDGNYLYYTLRDKGGNLGTLFRVLTLGGEPQKLIEDVDSNLTFAPDGARLAFVRHDSKKGADTVFIANADGSNVVPFLSTSETEFGLFNHLAWSPDGAKLIVGAGKSALQTKDNMQLAEISVNSKELKLISPRWWSEIDQTRWLKDGAGVLFIGREEPESPAQLWHLSIADGAFRQITNDINDYESLTISADNKTLITNKSTYFSSLWTFNAATKKMTQISTDSNKREGENGIVQGATGKIVYTRRDETEVNLWTADADFKNQQRLTSAAKSNITPIVTRDGRFFVFVSNRTGNFCLWRINSDGTNPVRLTEVADADDFEPQLLENDKTVVFYRQKSNGGQARLMKISIEGGTVEPFDTRSDGYEFNPRVSPDGSRLAYVSYSSTTETDRQRLSISDLRTNEKSEYGYELTDKFAWSPDSESLTLLRREGIRNLWKFALKTNKTTALTEFTAGNIWNFCWTGDGKNLLIVRGNITDDLILIKDASD